MISSTFRSILVATTFFATPTIAQAIGNFDIIYKNLSTVFQNNVVHEITLIYDIGKDRTCEVDLFDKNCEEAITGTVTNVTTNRTAGSTANHDELAVMVNLDKSTVMGSGSNIKADDGNPYLEFCVRLRLLLGDQVINEQ
jgi:hypothetical protein